MVVILPLGKDMDTDMICPNFEIKVRNVSMPKDFFLLSFDDYDVIFSMDWLVKLDTWMDCKRIDVQFCKPGMNVIEFK